MKTAEMPSETFQTAFLYYSGLTKIRTRRRSRRQYKYTWCFSTLENRSLSLADGLQQIRIRQMFQAEKKHDKNKKASEQSEALLSN
ncbi:hypothetical protein COH84_01330 [Neisseria meningitidis]|nr:hypothetical protein COH84_01330 [Neisseria meningitidis]RQL01248.1 hypothetical protein COH44_05935 [Neisseria meningitidis]